MFTQQEHRENLNRLKIKDYKELIGEKVIYVKESYGEHTVIDFKDDEYLLDLDGSRFYTNPFKIERKL